MKSPSPTGIGGYHSIMKCDRCKNEATLHDVKLVKGGVASEMHLCESCAAKLGIGIKSIGSVDEMLQQAISSQSGIKGVSIKITSGNKEASTQPGVCSNCSLTWVEFRDRGLFGCAQCYTTFEAKLGPLLERAHEGGTHHVGKCPARDEKRIDVQARIQHLRKRLAVAIASEQYEQAAQLRDSIDELAVVSPGGHAADTTDPPDASSSLSTSPGGEG